MSKPRIQRYAADARVIRLGDAKPTMPVNSDKCRELVASLSGGSKPTAESLYVWRTTGFVVKKRGGPRVVLPSVYVGQTPMTDAPSVRRWWSRGKKEARACGVQVTT